MGHGTSLTRARSQVDIDGSVAVLAQAIGRVLARTSGLAEQLDLD